MMEAQHYIRLYNAYTSRADKFIVVRPKSKAEADALYRHTTESFPEGKHSQKAWIVHSEQPGTARVRYLKAPVQVGWKKAKKGYERDIGPGLRVELVHDVRGGQLIDRDYIFKEVLGFQPGIDFTRATFLAAERLRLPADPWEQIRVAIEMLMDVLPDKTPRGHDAYYKILTLRHGPIGASVPKEMLVGELIRYGQTYAKGFAEAIIGVRYMGSEWQAVSPSNAKNADRQQDIRRAHYRKLAYQERLARMRQSRQSRKSRKPRKHK